MEQLQSLKQLLATLVQLVMAVAFSYFALHFTQLGLQELKHLRQLERIPQVAIAGVIDGETIVSGTIHHSGTYLQAPRSNTPSVYYHYLVERRCKDSEGRESWCTETSRHESVPFLLRDDSGELKVNPSRRVQWTAPRRMQETAGRYRYTEWRLEPGDQVNVIAWAQGKTLSFQQQGQYVPVISVDSVAAERGNVGHLGLIYLWLGVSLGLAALFCVMLVLRVHRVLLHVLTLTLAMVVFLAGDGFAMIRIDLMAAQQWLAERQQTALVEVERVFEENLIPWQGWQSLAEPDLIRQQMAYQQWQRVKAIYESLLSSQQNVAQQEQRVFARLALLGQLSERQTVPLFAWAADKLEMEQAVIKSRIAGAWPWIELAASGILALGFAWWAIRSVRWKRMIENLPTSKIKGVMPGLTEIKGLIQLPSDTAPLSSPLKNIPCVYYHYVVKEKRGSGKKSRWVTITDNKQALDFYCEDDTGKLLLSEVDKADVMCKRRFSSRRGNRRYSEKLIGTGDALYALGSCQINDQIGDQLTLAAGDGDDPFIVSSFSESQVMLKKARLGMGLLTAAFSAFMLLMLISFGTSGGFAFSDIVLAGLTAPILGLLVVLVLHYNDLIFLRQRVLRNWANVDVMLQKRFDLFNGLQPVVATSMDYEKDLLSLISQARSLYKPDAGDTQTLQTTIARQAEINRKIRLLQEDYPTLKSNDLVNRFMSLMASMETEISLVRAGYNDAVETYNSRLQSFPDLLLARSFGLSAAEFGRWA